MSKRVQQAGVERCEICYPIDDQTKSILLSLFDSLAMVRYEDGEKVPDSGGFYQLIKMIFSSKFKNFRKTIKCKHDYLRSITMERMGLDMRKLDHLCNKRACEIAKKNFHLDTISLQLKSFTRHFTSFHSEKPIKEKKVENIGGKTEIIKEEVDENVNIFNQQIQIPQPVCKPFPTSDYQFSQVMEKISFLIGQGIPFIPKV